MPRMNSTCARVDLSHFVLKCAYMARPMMRSLVQRGSALRTAPGSKCCRDTASGKGEWEKHGKTFLLKKMYMEEPDPTHAQYGIKVTRTRHSD